MQESELREKEVEAKVTVSLLKQFSHCKKLKLELLLEVPRIRGGANAVLP